MTRFPNRPSNLIRRGRYHLATAVVCVFVAVLHRSLATHAYVQLVESALIVTILFTTFIGATILAENAPNRPFKPVSALSEVMLFSLAVTLVGCAHNSYTGIIAPFMDASFQKTVMNAFVNVVCGLAMVVALAMLATNSALRPPKVKPAINP
ncbi:MAG: hypothetical protein EON60_05085 [Alphaproteobacteria bacterium]|nr:MAG: hypothetical protein EON60_05085 [Alphaproteobacteria bacterium]